MKVTQNTVVALTYELKVNDDAGNKQLVEKVDVSQPMVILFGNSGLPEKFENALEGKEPGESFTVEISFDDAYGEYEEEGVVKLPFDVFNVDGKFNIEDFPVGSSVPMSDQDGNMMNGRVLEHAADGLVMDFNHPLAGYDLFFEGKVEEVRLATEEEMDHGHVHGPGGHHH